MFFCLQANPSPLKNKYKKIIPTSQPKNEKQLLIKANLNANTISFIASVTANFEWTPFTNCLPQSIQFLDKSIVISGSIKEWLWDFGDGTISKDQYPLHEYKNNDNYIVKLTIITFTSDTATISKILTVNTQTPIVNLGKDTTVCIGDKVILDAGFQLDCTYFWSTGETSQSIEVNTTDNYWVQVSNSSCANTDDINVFVNPELSSAFKYERISNCLPAKVKFTDESKTCIKTIEEWYWDFGDGETSSQQHPIHSYVKTGMFTINLTVKDNTGKKITSSKTLNIDIGQLEISIGNDTTICKGNPFLLKPNIMGDSYLWSDGSTDEIFSINNEGTYWVEVLKSGCVGRDTIVIAATLPLIPNFNTKITSNCLPIVVHFSDSSEIVCGKASINYWKWNFGDGAVSNNQHPNHVYTKPGKFAIQLTVGNSDGVFATINSEVNIQNTGPVYPEHPNVTVCSGSKIELYAGNEGASYAWTPSNKLSDTTIQNPIAIINGTTLFFVTISRCGITIKDSVLVYADSIPKPKIEQNESGTLMASSIANTYQWYKDGKLILKANKKNYKPFSIGNYHVAVTNVKGCRNTSDNYFFLPGNGYTLPGTNIKIQLNPNPCKEVLRILLSKMPEKALTVCLYNAYGKKVHYSVINSNINNINVEHLNKGQYFVEIFVNNEKVIIPLMIF